jgi:hypothetical protein
MAIRPLPESLPSHLPPARLYLDDISELVEILSVGHAEPKVTFTVGNRLCDTLEDLAQLGGRATEFQIEVRSKYSNSDVIMSRHRTAFLVFGLDKNENWSKYAKVLAVFEKRKLRFKAMLGSSLPSTLSGALTALVVTGLTAAIFAKSVRWSLVCLALGLITLLLDRYFLRWHTVVEFRRSHEVGTSRWWREQKTSIILLAIGTLFGAIITIITEAIRRASR